MRRPTRLLLGTTVAAATLAGGLVTTGATPATAAARSIDAVRVNGFEASLVSQMNAARRASGLRSLVVAAGPTDVARRWTWRMANRQNLSHNPEIVRDMERAGCADWGDIAENVGEGPSTNPVVLFQAYMNSPAHRANILDRRVRYVGIGVVERDGVAWNTIDFVDAYSTAYGHTREPAAGLTMDRHRITSTTDVAMMETHDDQRFASRDHGSVAASRLRFTGPTSSNDAAYTVLRRTSRHRGHATVMMRDALDLSSARAVSFQLSVRNPRNRRVPVAVFVGRSYAQSVRIGRVVAGTHARWLTLSLPASTRCFRNTITLKVRGRAISSAGGRVRLNVFDVRAVV